MPTPAYYPDFNVTVLFWTPPATPAGGAASGSFLGQLFLPSRGVLDIQPSAPNFWTPPIYLRLSSVDRDTFGIGTGFIFELTVLTFVAHWKCRWWEFCHLGFANEYVQLLVEQCQPNGNTPDTGR